MDEEEISQEIMYNVLIFYLTEYYFYKYGCRLHTYSLNLCIEEII
jgi:hypothetical protein